MRINSYLGLLGLLACPLFLVHGADATEAVPGDQLACVPRYDVFETGVAGRAKVENPFRDATLRAEFHAPSGVTIPVMGFYNGGDEWRVRFVPREHGVWTWRTTLQAPPAPPVTREGTFRCEGTLGHGFLHVSARNPFRLEHDDGTPFYPVGIQTCNFLQPDFDGPNPDGSRRTVSNEAWLAAFTGAVNLVRTQFGQGTRTGCAMALIAARPPHSTNAFAFTPDRYDLNLAAQLDRVYQQQRAAGLSQILILFQDMSMWGGGRSAFGDSRDLTTNGFKSVHAPSLPQQEQYIRYIVARWGCYVDMWELYNEDGYAPGDYLAHLAEVVRSADPYQHLRTTNFTRLGAPWSDVNTWHEYMGMPANGVDVQVSQQIAIYKAHGKPVVNTEFGNQGRLSNVDPLKWRVAVWSAFMNEASPLFWGMSGHVVPAGYEKAGENANAYIGPETRQHFRIFLNFVHDLPVDLRPVLFGIHRHNDIRTYALSNGRLSVLYVHHFADHTTSCLFPEPVYLQSGPGRFHLRWIDPADGREVRSEDLTTPQEFLELRLPPVTVDLVGRLERRDD